MNIVKLFRRTNLSVPTAHSTSHRRRKSSIGSGIESLEDRRLLAATPELLATNPAGVGSSISSFVESNSTIFFFADDGVHGNELWKSDGTEAGTTLVKDIVPGPSSFSPRYWTIDVNGSLFFTGSDGAHGYELWKSDGTEAGTLMVKDIYTGNGNYGPNSSDPRYLTVFNGELFFAANDGTHGTELWKSDGTEAGTMLVKDINTGSDYGNYSSIPQQFTESNGTLFFTAWDGIHGNEIWKSDGTSEGTELVIDLVPGDNPDFLPEHLPLSSNAKQLADINGSLYFTVSDYHGVGKGTFSLWNSDGTSDGTVPIKEIGQDLHLFNCPSLYQETVNGTVYFTAPSPATLPNLSRSFVDLWKSNGTEAGTTLVKDKFDCSGGDVPRNMTENNGKLYFTAPTSESVASGTLGLQLWTTDGTSGGTVILHDDVPSLALTSVGRTLFFTGNDLAHGPELWKSDGTKEGTVLISDIRPGGLGTQIIPSIELHGSLYFAADDNAHGLELWKTDGLEATFIKDINPSAAATLIPEATCIGCFGRPNVSMANLNGTLMFGGGDSSTGNELWKSEGTSVGTVRVKDINPAGDSYPYSMVAVNDTLFFGAIDDEDRDLWTSDGTEAGTVLVKDINGDGPYYLTNIDGTVFFTKNDQVWKSDGTEAGTVRIRNTPPRPSFLTNVNGTLFLNSRTDAGLWTIDGTLAVTKLTDVRTSSLTNVNGTLFFRGFDSRHGSELWKSDGTAAGTSLVKEIIPGTGISNDWPWLTNVDGTLYFTSQAAGTGLELWKSDGTEAGTVLVKDVRSGSLGSNPSNLTNVGGKVFFFADDGVHGQELWTSDGTDEGTVLVKDIAAGETGSYELGWGTSGTMNAEGRLYFVADDGVHGRELWRSDGTADGTVMVSDIRPGAEGSNVWNLFDVDGKLFFTADDGTNGRGLWVLRPDTVEPPIPGDSNHDGIFNSSDLIKVFQAGEYEDGIPGNSTFEEGDWNNDGDFDSGDLVYVFQQGNYTNAAIPQDPNFDSVLAAISRRDLTERPEKPVVVASKTSIPGLIAQPVNLFAASIDRVFADLMQDQGGTGTVDKHADSVRNVDSTYLEEFMV